MSLHKSILETLYKDALSLENTLNQTILHGKPDNLHNLIGHTSRAQWFRVLLSSISVWCENNPTATEAPESLLPSNNAEINTIMNGGSVAEPSETESEV